MLFRSTGALAFESLSRGAVSATLVEKSPRALRVLRSNAASLGGADALKFHLDDLFHGSSATTGRDQADITGLIGQYAHGNEPSHHIAWLYSYTDAPGKGERLVEYRGRRFVVTDTAKTVPVRYQGILPDLFKEGKGVVAQGQMNGGVFEAREVLAKHDENYMPPEAAEAVKKAGEFVEYTATVVCTRTGQQGYSARILPKHDKLAHPFIPGLVRWA